MKPRSLLILIAILAVATVFVRLGFWQISRWHEKRALNASLRAALARPPFELGAAPAPLDSVRDRRVAARGRYDESHQILLSGRAHQGSPGVDVVTPLVLPSGSGAVLVDRGWVYASDAASADPGDYPEPGEVRVVGVAEALQRGAGGLPVRRLDSDSVALYSARWLDLDSLAGRFPYALAPYYLKQLPGPGVPEQPVRSTPRPLNETMHVSYAIQWFLFAVILLGGSAALAWSRRARGRAAESSDLEIDA